MPLQLEIISEHRDIVGDDAVREFSEDGGTIGRSLQSDWILPDPSKYVSGKHAVIDYKGGIYYIVDLSTNGVYVNGEHEPIGKGNPRRLFNGDRLRMGDFEITASIDQGESIVMPLEGEQTELEEPVELMVDEVSIKTGVQLLEEEAITGDAMFSNMFDSEPKQPVVELLKPERQFSEPETKSPVGRTAPFEFTSDDLFDTFLDGLGISRSDLHPTIDPAEVMQNAGEILKEFVAGTAKLLVSRANLKTAFSLDQTTVLPRHNNPLKLSENTAASIKQLLIGREGEYLGPRDAVREVCRDLLFHQDAFLDAMSNAFTEFAVRFDPDELAESFEHSIDSKPFLGFMNKFKFWQLYCDLYPILTEKGSGKYPQMFAEEFVQSYERQIAEFKRLNPSDTIYQAPVFASLTEQEIEEEELKRTISQEIDNGYGEADNDSDASGSAEG